MNEIKIKYHNLILLLLPVLLICAGLYMKNWIPLYYLRCMDPEYSYLFNGLNLAHLNFPWHLDHPGTPLQLLSALVIRVVHLFRSGPSLNVDVFSDPEFYINAIVYTLISINAVVLAVSGYVIYRISGSYSAAFLIQLAPFSSAMSIAILNRVIVEQLFIAIVLILVVIMIAYIYETKERKSRFNKFVVLFSIIVALGISDKITFIPVFFLPFILLEGRRNKITYSWLTFLCFAVFVFPVYSRLGYFRDWVKKLFLHSGHYGQGPADIVNVQDFGNSLNTIIHTERVFTVLFVLILGLFVLYNSINFRWRIPHSRSFRAVAGILVVMSLMTLMVAKQYKNYYLVPGLLLAVPGLYFVFKLYTEKLKWMQKPYIALPAVIALIPFFWYQESRDLINSRSHSIQWTNRYINTLRWVEKDEKGHAVLILGDYFGAPYKGLSMFFGTAWCGPKMTERYSNDLVITHPHSYTYHSWNNRFNYWKGAFSFIELMKQHHIVTLYVGDTTLEQSLIPKLHGINRQLDCSFTELFQNPETGERIYRIRYDSLMSEKTMVVLDAENMDSTGRSFQNNDGIIYQNGESRTSDHAFSGKYSSIAFFDSAGMQAVISEITSDMHCVFSVWRHKSNTNAGLVIADKDSSVYYQCCMQPVMEKGEWQLLKLDVIMPGKMNNHDLIISCKNFSKDLPAYFDDLYINWNAVTQ